MKWSGQVTEIQIGLVPKVYFLQMGYIHQSLSKKTLFLHPIVTMTSYVSDSIHLDFANSQEGRLHFLYTKLIHTQSIISEQVF
jgi:hypothetical protein